VNVKPIAPYKSKPPTKPAANPAEQAKQKQPAAKKATEGENPKKQSN